jgi:hypothetical protein
MRILIEAKWARAEMAVPPVYGLLARTQSVDRETAGERGP